MKKTLAFSEEERIGWSDLFEMFGQKSIEKIIDNVDSGRPQIQQSSKDRNVRLAANSVNSWSQQQLTPQNNSLTVNMYSNRPAATSVQQPSVMAK